LQLHREVTEEVVDGEELGHGALVGVGLLGGEEGVAELGVRSGGDLSEQGLVVEVGGVVSQRGRSERRRRWRPCRRPVLGSMKAMS